MGPDSRRRSGSHLIPFFKPYLTGREIHYLQESLAGLSWAGDGPFSKKCSALLTQMTAKPVLLTPSGTAALELALMTLNLKPGDEVILPSFTFVSTATAVVQMGLVPIFVDIRSDTLNLDECLIEPAITAKTKAIIPVHYAGISCDMDQLRRISKQHGLKIVEDAAQGVHAFYRGSPLGTLGDLGAFSFHQTKNLTCGEGGALVLANESYLRAAEIHREKGTNRSDYLRRQVNKYTWVDRGSSYLLSDLLASFLCAQLEASEEIIQKRKKLFERYQALLSPWAHPYMRLPAIPENSTPNYHIFYILLEEKKNREALQAYLRKQGIETATHFIPLHNSTAGKKLGKAAAALPVTEKTADTLLRLPIYPELAMDEIDTVCHHIQKFFEKRN